jgi:uncharacterized membrane protein
VNGDSESGFGVSHLASTPITLTFGVVLLFALLVLIFLRVVFGEISVSGGARA